MCLAIPAKIESLDGDGLATASIMGARRQVSLDLTPGVGVDDYVLVHAGFAIEVVDKDVANQTLEIIKDMPEFAEIY